MMLRHKTILVLLFSLGILASGAIATAQRPRPVQPTSTPSQAVWSVGMHHRDRLGPGMMPMMSLTSEFEYLSQMIPHHQEAIDTAQIILQRSDRPDMQKFAQEIIEVQSNEISQMRIWLNEWYPERRTTWTYTPMMRNLRDLDGDALDQAFLEDMIDHHHMAVMMSRMVVNHQLIEHEAVRPFADRIATAQMNEIQHMQTWLSDWFGAPGGRYQRGGCH